MRGFKVLFLTLVLLVAACRSIPGDVVAAHEIDLKESKSALVKLENVLKKVESKTVEFNVQEVYSEWTEHFINIVAARIVVSDYLKESKEFELSGAYNTGLRLLEDLDGGFTFVAAEWLQVLHEANDVSRVKLLVGMRKDIARYRILQRKFDEWIRQFKVSG